MGYVLLFVNKFVSFGMIFFIIQYQLLMTEAILSFCPYNVWSMRLSRTTQRRLHLILQTIGAMFALYGSFVNFYDRARKLKDHLISIHACFGMLAAMFAFTTMFNGISALWSSELTNFAQPIHFKLVHSSNGVISFLLGKKNSFQSIGKPM